MQPPSDPRASQYPPPGGWHPPPPLIPQQVQRFYAGEASYHRDAHRMLAAGFVVGTGPGRQVGERLVVWQRPVRADQPPPAVPSQYSPPPWGWIIGGSAVTFLLLAAAIGGVRSPTPVATATAQATVRPTVRASATSAMVAPTATPFPTFPPAATPRPTIAPFPTATTRPTDTPLPPTRIASLSDTSSTGSAWL